MMTLVPRFLVLSGALLLWTGQALAAVTALGTAPGYSPGMALRKVGDNVLFVREFNWGADHDLARIDPATGAVSALKDIDPASANDLALSETLVTHQGLLYFWANDPVHGLSLWRTDGTTTGTHLFMDLITDQGLPADTYPVQTLSVEGRFLLVVTGEPAGGLKLWRIDPDAGTATRLANGLAAVPSGYGFIGDSLHFLVQNTLWASDGSADSATPASSATIYGLFLTLADKPLVLMANALQVVSLGDGSLTPLNTPNPGVSGWQDVALRTGNRFVFSTPGADLDSGLWISDGSVAGTTLLTNRLPWYAPIALAYQGGALYPSHTASGSFELRRVDAAGTITTLATLAPTSDYYPLRMMQAGNLVFVLKHSSCCVTLWSTDGTAAGTHEVFHSTRTPDQSWELMGGSDDRFYLTLTDFAAGGPARVQVYTPGATVTGAGGGGGGGAASPWLLAPLLLLAWRRRSVRRPRTLTGGA